MGRELGLPAWDGEARKRGDTDGDPDGRWRAVHAAVEAGARGSGHAGTGMEEGR